MPMKSCVPVIPSADLEKSLRFWVGGPGLSMDRAMRQEGRLVGSMVHNEHVHFWLNQRAGSPSKPEDYEGIRLYWAPDELGPVRERLLELSYSPSEIVNRDYGQTELFVTDDDGYSHCFGVPAAGLGGDGLASSATILPGGTNSIPQCSSNSAAKESVLSTAS